MEDLRKARIEHNLDRRMRVYLSPKVLVVDEFGIWPYDREAATAFFTLVSARYERGSIILTSNKGFGEWGDLWGTPSSPRRCWTGYCTTATCSTSGGRASGQGETPSGALPFATASRRFAGGGRRQLRGLTKSQTGTRWVNFKLL